MDAECAILPAREIDSMDSAPSQPDASGSVSANLKLRVGSYELQAALTVPAAPIKPQAVLPALHALVDAVVNAAERELDGTGRSVSCKLGCAACCRQAVTMSPIEAYHIRDLVEALTEPRRGVIKGRFVDVSERVKNAGLYAALMDPSGLSQEQREQLALDYLALGIACPFLEAETCSIYADRPSRCREYLVTSPPQRCATPGNGDLDPVNVPRLSRALQRVGAGDGAITAWPPLCLALDWVAAHPDDLPLRTGPEWVQDILGRVAKPSPGNGLGAPPAAEEPETPSDEAAGDSVALPMPPGEVTAVDMLPTFRAYTEAAVAHAIDYSIAQGKTPSCRAGCSACCHHQMVPISTTEARRIAAVVDAMPEPRRSAVRARFDDADRRITVWNESSGQGLGLNRERQTEDERLGAYFSLGISCPMLENDQCSIYEERPLVCREYLVTTPAENCARLEEPGVVVEPVPRMFTEVALGHLLSDETPPKPSRVLLAQSLRWVAEHPEPSAPRRTAEAWLNRFFERLNQVDALRPRHRANAGPATDSAPESVELKLDVPAQRVLCRDILPAARAITDAAVQHAVARVEAQGRPVSCKAGCSACCNQLVPVGAVEAHMIAALVDRLPEPRRQTVRSRFAAAEARLAAWEHRADLDDVDRPPGKATYQIGADYFRFRIACPFLEDDTCSIYAERPLACREHLVTSPAAQCARQDDPAAVIDVVPASDASLALARLEDGAASQWQRMPLTLALSWAAAHPETPENLPGRVWVERFVSRLRGLR
jgi:Fe-S-cluster containining protein